jgi:hypothetical protein
MIAIVKAFFSANILRILAIAFATLAALGVLFGARQTGKNAERVDNLKRQIKDVQEAETIRREVAGDYRDGKRPKRVQKFDID